MLRSLRCCPDAAYHRQARLGFDWRHYGQRRPRLRLALQDGQGLSAGPAILFYTIACPGRTPINTRGGVWPRSARILSLYTILRPLQALLRLPSLRVGFPFLSITGVVCRLRVGGAVQIIEDVEGAKVDIEVFVMKIVLLTRDQRVAAIPFRSKRPLVK